MIVNPNEKPRPQAADVRQTPAERIAESERGARMVAKIVRTLLDERVFADPSTLRDAVEARCASLRLACTRSVFERALDLVSSNTQLFAARRRPTPTTARVDEVAAIDGREAQKILAGLGVDVRHGRLQARAAPSPSQAPPHFPRLR